MFFIEDVLKKIFYLCIIGIVLVVGYVAFDIFILPEVSNYLATSPVYAYLRNTTWIDWAKVGIIVFSPIVTVFVVIMSQGDGFSFRKTKRSVDYQQRIKNKWK